MHVGEDGVRVEAPPAEIEGASRLSLPLASGRPGLRGGGGGRWRVDPLRARSKGDCSPFPGLGASFTS